MHFLVINSPRNIMVWSLAKKESIENGADAVNVALLSNFVEICIY